MLQYNIFIPLQHAAMLQYITFNPLQHALLQEIKSLAKCGFAATRDINSQNAAILQYNSIRCDMRQSYNTCDVITCNIRQCCNTRDLAPCSMRQCCNTRYSIPCVMRLCCSKRYSPATCGIATTSGIALATWSIAATNDIHL